VAQLGSEGEATGLTGCRLGPYQVRERIGAGGMGEVYRARDSKLGRDVAVKVLPPHSMQDPDVVARFEREARLLATLNHPNIGAIYGFESAGDVHAIVLELIDGETLTQRINYAPIPILEAVGIARQIADALDAAHSRGIIHRDLKPGNIKITSESVVKVLDFGLAKAVTPQHFDDGDSETLSLSQTAIGTILGTPAYMSPEQASGEPVDKRTDIWAFGCVFYQMITGRSAFGRDSILDTLAAIIDGAADMSALPANTPYGVRRLLERCLEKDPRRRLRDIADGVLLLDEAGPALPADGAAQAGLRPGWMQWALAAIVLGAVGAGLALWIQAKKNDPARAAIVRTTIVLPGGAKLASGDRELPLAISPDGSRIAYVADEDGRRVLYVREMNSLEPRALAGADEARHPFFSPDGESVGYFADGALQRVPVSGGLPLRICDVPGVSMGGTWAPDHTIVFATYGSDLARVSDSGGSPKALEGSAPAAWPETLPDGKTILFTSGAGNNLSALAMIPMAGGAKRVFARLATSALQAPAVIGSGGSLLEAHVVRSGYLLYGQSPGVIRVVPFDLAAQKVTGSPLSLGGSVERAKNGGGVYFAVSQTGLLVYASTGNRHQLVWVDRKGNATPLLPDKGPYRMPRISPDGRLLAVALSDDTRRADIWIVDLESGTRHRLTTQEHNLVPAWTPDGTQITFSNVGGVRQIPLNGGPIRTLIPMPGAYTGSWSPDGKNLLYGVDGPKGRNLMLFTPGAPGNPPGRVLIEAGSTLNPRYSPDGRWIAYTTATSVRPEVYVASAPDLAGAVTVSTNGGEAPVWSKRGDELFYREGDAMMRVPLNLTQGIHAGKPERLFSGSFSGESHDVSFDVTGDGQRFVMVKSDEAATLTTLTVVQNWAGELKK
jgi:Tol biopolymer transport system component/tRNA A-37 threonylcarbamoyl transferase component Bud32